VGDARRDKTIAASAFDVWRRWVEISEDEVDRGADPTIHGLRALLLQRGQSPAMLAGTAGHKLLEELAAGRLASVTIEDVATRAFGQLPGHSRGGFGEFDFDPLENVANPPAPSVLEHGTYCTVAITDDEGTPQQIELVIEIPVDADIVVLPIAEQRVEATYDTPIGPVRVNGRIDGSDGIEILDYKFTGKPDPEELERSWQWRLYLDATGAQRFRWELVTMKPPLKSETAWRLQRIDTLHQYAYPGLHEDVCRAVAQFAVLIDRYVPEYWDRTRARAGAPKE
jgi:hypothetical protein